MANLLNKLIESKMEAAKRIGAVALAGALVLGGTTACTNLNPNNPSNGGISNQGNPTTSTTPNTQDTSPNKENSKHSDLLMSVVNDEYYKSLMSRTKIEDYAIPALDPHPYAFLEDEGIDVDKILDGTYKATTMTFVYDDEPNNLYMNTRVLIDDSYYQAYLLTYELTDKEMADYKLIHGDKTKYSYSWPAFFINDKISETKEPTNVLSTKYTKKTHEVFQKKVDSYVNGLHDYVLPSIDMSFKSYIYLQYPRYGYTDVAVVSRPLIVAKFKYSHIRNSNGIYEISNNFDYAQLIEKDKKNATTFDLQQATIFRGKDFETVSEQS